MQQMSVERATAGGVLIPRPYQREAVDAVKIHLDLHGSTILVAATGTGKTAMFALLCKEWPREWGRILILAHRRELVKQAWKMVNRVCPDDGVDMEMDTFRANHGGGLFGPASRIVVASKDTLVSRLRAYDPKQFGLVITDECFPAGTLIDGRRIEDIAVGDSVRSFNHATGQIEERKVTCLFRSVPSALVAVRFSDGRRIVCTPGHPFYSATTGRYVPAMLLKNNDMVFSVSRERRGYGTWTEEDSGDGQALFGVRDGIRVGELADAQASRLLHERVREGSEREDVFCPHGCYEQEICLRQDEGEESDDGRGHSSAYVGDAKEDRALSEDAGRERKRGNGAGTRPLESAGLVLSSYRPDQDATEFWLPRPLQGGYRMPGIESGNRDRRPLSRLSQSQGGGCEEGEIPDGARVDSVEVLQRGCDGQPSDLCPDGHVYNIEVEGNHNYFVSGVLVHNCHHAVKKNSSYWTVLRHFNRAKQLGVTATPDRHDQEALGGIYKSVAYSYDILQAVTDAFLVPIQQQVVTVTGLDFSGIKEAKKGDLDPEDLDFIMKNEAIVQRIVNPTIDLANSGGKQRRVLFFATSVDQARLMAEVINRRCPGKAIALSGEDEKDVRDGALDKYRAGDYQFLCGCEIFTEGFDEPTIQIVVPKPTQARSKYAQMIGRGTRTWPGVLDAPGLETVEARRHAIRHSPKPSLLVLDFCGVSGQHKLITAVDIMGGVFSPEVVAKAKERLAGKGEGGGRGELLTELRAARKELEEMEADRRRKIVAKAAFEMRPVDPFDLFDVVPKKEPRWLRGRKATLKQVQYLLRNSPEGTRLPDDLSLHDASVLIEDIKTKKEAGPPTEKMALTLQRFGYATEGMTYKDAKGILDELSAAGWKRIDKAAPSREEGSHDDSD